MNDDTNQGADGATEKAADAPATSNPTPSTGTTASSESETSSTSETSEPAAQGTTSDNTDHGHPEAGASMETIAAGADSTTGSIVDKTLDDLRADADKLGGDLKGSAEVLVDQKVRHPAHSILDEFEAHLSQFDAYAVAALHGFLNRLRQAI